MPRLDLDQVTRQYFARIHRAALVLRGNPWDADDLAQETFLVLSRQADRFEGRSNLFTWLYGILLNLDRRERRRYTVRQRSLRVLRDQQSPAAGPPADSAAEVAEWKRSLWGLVQQLPDGQRQALVLRYSEGLRYDEIAEVLECPLGTVKSRLYNGLVALRRLVQQQGDGSLEFPLPSSPPEDVPRAS